MGLSVIALVVFYGSKNDQTFREWARMEAIAREKHIENGGELEFGKYYSVMEYEQEAIDQHPKQKEV